MAKHRKSRKSHKTSCHAVKVRGGRYRNSCTGRFTRKPR